MKAHSERSSCPRNHLFAVSRGRIKGEVSAPHQLRLSRRLCSRSFLRRTLTDTDGDTLSYLPLAAVCPLTLLEGASQTRGPEQEARASPTSALGESRQRANRGSHLIGSQELGFLRGVLHQLRYNAAGPASATLPRAFSPAPRRFCATSAPLRPGSRRARRRPRARRSLIWGTLPGPNSPRT